MFFFISFGVQAQGNEQVTDTVKKGYDVGKVEFKNPPSIIEAYTYDPVTDRYVYTNSVDGFNINYPIILTPKEYEKLVLRESMRDYFKKNRMPLMERRRKRLKDLLPRYYINSGF